MRDTLLGNSLAGMLKHPFEAEIYYQWSRLSQMKTCITMSKQDAIVQLKLKLCKSKLWTFKKLKSNQNNDIKRPFKI